MTEPTTGTVPVEFLRGVIALCTQRGYSPENIEAWSTDDKWIADLWRQAAQMLAAAPAPPAPATQQPEWDVVAYLDVGASGYLDLGAALSEDALQQLPKGRHALVIAGTYGIDGYVAAPHPSPTAQADGFFLLLPQRPKPEAPAGTAGLDWCAYSGAQMLAFGRDCSDAAIAALRTEQPAPATQQAGERVYAFRRKGLADFCTCDEARYEELSNKPHLFETRIFYTAPQPVAREPLSDEEVDSLCKIGPVYAPDGKVTLTPPQYRYELESAQRYGLRKGERAHGIKKGGQHEGQ